VGAKPIVGTRVSRDALAVLVARRLLGLNPAETFGHRRGLIVDAERQTNALSQYWLKTTKHCVFVGVARDKNLDRVLDELHNRPFLIPSL
jgi:hypothetical protein